GRPVGPKDEAITLTLSRDDEAPEAPTATLPPLLSRAEEKALAKRVLGPYADRVLKEGGEPDRIQVLEAMARTDPGRVLELLEAKPFAEPFLNMMMRLRVATGLRDDAPDEALAVVESIGDSAGRAMALAEASEHLPPAEGARKRELLARAAVDARGAKDPSFRLLMTAKVAEGWLDLGETDKGTALLRENQAEAEKMPNAGFAGYA